MITDNGVVSNLAVFAVRSVWLGLVLLAMVAISRLQKTLGSRKSGARLLKRPWSVTTVSFMVLGIYSIPLFVAWLSSFMVGALPEVESRLAIARYTHIISEVATWTIMLWMTLRGEMMRNLFVPKRVALANHLAIVGVVAVTYLLLREVIELIRGDLGSGLLVQLGQWTLVPLTLGSVSNGLIVSIAEESVFRAAVFDAFQERVGTVAGTVLSSLLFASSHVATPHEAIALVIFGSAACLLRIRTGALWAPCLFHFLAYLLIIMVAP